MPEMPDGLEYGPGPSQHKPPINNGTREDSTPVTEQGQGLFDYTAELKGEE